MTAAVIPFPRRHAAELARAAAAAHWKMAVAEMLRTGLRGGWRLWVQQAEDAEAILAKMGGGLTRPSTTLLVRAAFLCVEAAGFVAAANNPHLTRGRTRLLREAYRRRIEAERLDPDMRAWPLEAALAAASEWRA